MIEQQKIKIGLLGVGLDTYWTQFDGLYARLVGYQHQIRKQVEAMDVDVVDVGIVDNSQKALESSLQLKQVDIEFLFVFVATYALSSTILPVARSLNVPIIILNIQPEPAINYTKFDTMKDRGIMTGEWLAFCQACSIPEFASVFSRSGIRYDIITGYLQEEYVWQEVKFWIDAAKVKRGMSRNRLGILGHYYGGMLDVYTDLTRQSATWGTHIEIVEMCELKAFWDEVTSTEIRQKMDEFNQVFSVSSSCEVDELHRAARTSVALDKLVNAHQLGSLAYYYEGFQGNEYENIVTSVIAGNTLLTGKGIPVAGECEIKNAQAMKILSLLNAGGSFAEFYAMDFKDDIIMLGHDGPAHFAMAEEKVKLVPLPIYHGKPGKGLSIQMTVKAGNVTLLSVCERKEGIFLLAAEGEAVQGPILPIGNTNSRYRFTCGARSFIDRWCKAGPSHHCAIGIGHRLSELKKLAFLLGIPLIIID